MRRKLISLIAFMLCGMLTFSACKFGENDPSLSEPSESEQPNEDPSQQIKPDDSDDGDNKPNDSESDDGKHDEDEPDDGKGEGGGVTPSKPQEPVLLMDDIEIEAGKFFDPMAGVRATMGEEGEDITSRVLIKGYADTSRVGEYDLTYSVTADGKTATHVRKVTVTNNPSIGKEKPVFLYESQETFNIAHGCRAFSSSELGDAKATKATDGDGATRWESVHGVDEVTLTVDLGAVVPVEEVSILWEAAYAQKFEILYSTNDENYYTACIEENFNFQNGVAAVYPLNETARYIRIACHKRATIYGYSVFELSVIPTEKFPILYNSEREQIVDEQSFTYDLGSVREFDTMEISWKDGSPLSYDVTISSDGTNYRKTEQVGNGFREGTVSARYVKLLLHSRRFYMSAYRISQTIFRRSGVELGGGLDAVTVGIGPGLGHGVDAQLALGVVAPGHHLAVHVHRQDAVSAGGEGDDVGAHVSLGEAVAT